MIGIPNSRTRTARQGASLPRWLARYATAAPYGLAVGTALCLVALVTNPVPDPSFPWATLPESWRLPVSQPRIEHWPVTYTVGIWLWVFCVPGVVLAGWRRYRNRWRVSTTTWLVQVPAMAMFGLTTYCRLFWPKLQPSSWNAPSYTFVCWLYCSTYDPLWSNLAYGIATLGVIAGILAYRDHLRASHAIGAFGVLAFPLGLPALFEAYRRERGRS